LTRCYPQCNILLMATNFDFLRATDVNLYDIISDAEKLYRDEYFEQCITQTRRFAENVCKNVLGDMRTTEETFDQMLATLKDKSQGSEQEKEFLDDLYFLKKCGNMSAHSSTVKKDGINALECLQRAFETAINYAVYNHGGSKDILNLHYDIKLLATGKKDKNLAKKYQTSEENQKKNNAAKQKQIPVNKANSSVKKASGIKGKKKQPQQSTIKSVPKKKKFSLYWLFVEIFSVIAAGLIIYLLVK